MVTGQLKCQGWNGGIMEFEVNTTTGEVICEWFALCDNVAHGVVEHPVLGYVPICERCAEKCGLDVIPATFDYRWEDGHPHWNKHNRKG